MGQHDGQLNILIAAVDGVTVAERHQKQLASIWPDAVGARFLVVEFAELLDHAVDAIDAVIIHAPGGNSVVPPSTLTVLTTFDEAGVPVLALLDAHPGAGNPWEFAHALIVPTNADDTTVTTALRALLCRQPTVRRLLGEVALARRFHGGLEGEIAKMHEELQLAAMVQREFLPRELPEVCGVSFDAMWRPTNYVSGDIYDVHRLDEDHVAVFLADAVGHGVPAALMTMVIARSLQTKEVDENGYRIVQPSEVLSRLNQAMIRRQGRSTRFATAAYAVVDCRSRTMTLAGAGHPPPLLLRAGGEVEALETDGGLLGVFDDEVYQQIDVELHLGDSMVIYSDGFEQAFPESADTSHDRKMPTQQYLEEFRALNGRECPCDMVKTIAGRLDGQSGSMHQLDDLTMICMYAGTLTGRPSDSVPKNADLTV